MTSPDCAATPAHAAATIAALQTPSPSSPPNPWAAGCWAAAGRPIAKAEDILDRLDPANSDGAPPPSKAPAAVPCSAQCAVDVLDQGTNQRTRGRLMEEPP